LDVVRAVGHADCGAVDAVAKLLAAREYDARAADELEFGASAEAQNLFVVQMCAQSSSSSTLRGPPLWWST
jgi:hypothetical protein